MTPSLRFSARIPFTGLIIGCMIASSSCSTGRKKTDPEISELEGKKVALVEIDGESNARTIVEAALVNQLLARGSFILIPEKDVMKARSAPDQNPTDWPGIARRAGADYALKAKVLEFSADEKDTYAAMEEDDSQLAAESGDGKTERIYDVKTLEGSVRVELSFAGVTPQAETGTRTAIAEDKEQVSEDSRSGAIHLPPKLRFLENLSNAAFKKFFETYN